MEIYDESSKRYIDVPRDQSPPNYVRALTTKQSAPIAYPVTDGAITQHTDGRAFEALPGVVETATPFWRSVAMVIRAIAPALLITALVLMAAWIVGVSDEVAAGILVFGAILVGGFWLYTDKLERRDSAAGIEHHKIDAAADLARLREKNTHKLKRALVNNYIGSLNHDSQDD